MIGGPDSPIPFHTLFTGMIFIQIFYWSTNQNITQRAMAAPTVKEAQKGVMAAAMIRILIVPPIVVIPGIVAYKMFGDIGDAAYGRLVAEVLPGWLSGAFAAMVAAAVITTFSSVLNSSVALYSVDLHEQFIGPVNDHWKLAAAISVLLTIVAIMLVPLYQNAESIINLLQQLNGLVEHADPFGLYRGTAVPWRCRASRSLRRDLGRAVIWPVHIPAGTGRHHFHALY